MSGKSPLGFIRWISALLLIAVALSTNAGCTRKKVEVEYLIRVRNLSMTLSEFNQAVKAASEEAFPGEQNIDSAALNDLRMRVLNQITEEMMISSYAADQGIQVTTEELEKAIEDIKADYPDNTFEETLLENAISFQYWQKQLATRLLVEKVIAKELVLPVQITSEDIAEYYKANYPQGVPGDKNADEINQRIIKHLRQQKAELAYKEWIASLRKTYPVEIDHQLWDRLTGGAPQKG